MSAFKWAGASQGPRSVMVTTIRQTILSLETNIPAAFMHTNWPLLRWVPIPTDFKGGGGEGVLAAKFHFSHQCANMAWRKISFAALYIASFLYRPNFSEQIEYQYFLL